MRKRFKPLGASLLILALLWPLGDALRADTPATRGPEPRAFRKVLLEVIKEYPTNGTHRYHWPRKGSWKGVTRDLVYQGTTIAKGDPKKRCYCCGLTFEVFFRAYQRWAKKEKRPFQIGALDAKGVRRLIGEWFGSNGDRRCLQSAIVKNELGARISKLEKARSGDFVQFWRHSGSGHSVVFMGWERDSKGKISALRYWSTQGSTNGVGIRTERIGPRGIKRDEIYIARIGE